jgi:hypothetical protein
VSLVKQVIDAECHDLHGRYLPRRDQLSEICRNELSGARPVRARSLLTAGAIAVSSGIYAKLR